MHIIGGMWLLFHAMTPSTVEIKLCVTDYIPQNTLIVITFQCHNLSLPVNLTDNMKTIDSA